ncbi:hypothetical protein C8R43DRAFT_561912 [Mycena crocata]|nr:hypothetical protein C8R43DRAFT_561912 [Mycena crocata]
MAALPRDVMSTKGKDVLDYALFLLLVDDLDEKPVDFLSIMKASVSATDVLKAIMLKIDERLLDNEVESVDSGFYTVVGHIWITCGKDMERTCEWLRLIFGPLLEAASAAYMAECIQRHPPFEITDACSSLKRSKRDRNGKETIRYQPQDSGT